MPSLPVTMASTSLCAGSLPLAAANAATTVPAAFDLSVPPLEIRALMSARDWGRCCDQIGASGCCGQARCRPGSAAAPPPPPGHRLLSASLSHSSHREPSSHGVRWRWPYGNIDIIRGRFLADLSVLHPARAVRQTAMLYSAPMLAEQCVRSDVTTNSSLAGKQPRQRRASSSVLLKAGDTMTSTSFEPGVRCSFPPTPRF